MSNRDKQAEAAALAAEAAKQKNEAKAAEAAAAKEQVEAEAAEKAAAVAAAEAKAEEAALLGSKGWFKTKLGYSFWHPFQLKMVGNSIESAAELEVDGWVLTQLGAGYIEQVAAPEAK